MSYGFKSFSHCHAPFNSWEAVKVEISTSQLEGNILESWIEGWRLRGGCWEKMNFMCGVMWSVGWRFRETMHAQCSQKERDACAVRYSTLAIVDATRNRHEKNSLTLLKWDRCAVKLECWRFIAKLLRITDSYWESKCYTRLGLTIWQNIDRLPAGILLWSKTLFLNTGKYKRKGNHGSLTLRQNHITNIFKNLPNYKFHKTHLTKKVRWLSNSTSHKPHVVRSINYR